ncbi:tripartite tricarboxylate transporter TctB family protein [Pseudonocardia sp. Ae707_Ps2]
MRVPSTASFPGPQVFPAVVAGVCLVLAALLALDVLRRPEPAAVARPTPADDLDASTPAIAPHPEHDTRPRANRRALAEAIGAVVVFIAALQPVGWLLSGALLFWGVARALGSRRPVFDVFLALSFSSAVQLGFSAGLGLNLPPGLLAGAF